jgi:hypothetical protein
MRHRFVTFVALSVLLLFSASARAQTTALFIHGEPGNEVFPGTATFTPAQGFFVAHRYGFAPTVVDFISFDESLVIRLEFAAPGNGALQVGEYLAARRISTPFAGMQVSSDYGGCNTLSGRFVVHEIAYAPSGDVLRFSADFEQFCDGEDPGVFGAIRFNAEEGSLTPFGGEYPVHALTVGVPSGGRVHGGSIDCAAESAVCEASFGAPTTVTLSAVADPGFLFAGWSGNCAGSAVTSLRVRGRMTCSAHFQPDPPVQPRTLLMFHSQVGDLVGFGETRVLSAANSVWTVQATPGGQQVDLMIRSLTTLSAGYISVRLVAPEGAALEPGRSYDARRSPLGPAVAGLDVSNDSHGCSAVRGRFDVHDLAYGAGGVLERLAVDIEHHCGHADAGLFVAIRYNSLYPESEPFGGQYPRYRVEVTPVAGGRAIGSRIDCGLTSPACVTDLLLPGPYALTAIPDAGYLFAGWTGACHGGETTTLYVSGIRRCSPTFAPRFGGGTRSLLRLEESPGHYVGQGRPLALSPANSRWGVQSTATSLAAQIAGLTDLGETTWSLSVWAALGDTLQAGRTYSIPATSPTGPGLRFSGDGRSCSSDTGSFTVREFERGAGGVLLRASVTFEHYCNIPVNPLRGSFEYNATVESGGFWTSTQEMLFAGTARHGSVGHATRVEGARPDIVTRYPNHPGVSRAGWGYLLLTNMLPNGGNGTFTLHAYADDAEGNAVLLGSRTIR